MTPGQARPFGDRLRDLASHQGASPALTHVRADGSSSTLSYAELHQWSEDVAVLMAGRGVDDDSCVVVGLGNTPEQVVAFWAAWKLGAMVLPLSPRLPSPERDALLGVALPTLVVADWSDVPGLRGRDVRAARGTGHELASYRLAHPGKAVGSGGSTGRPKIIVDPTPLARVPGSSLGPVGDTVGFHDAAVHLVVGPLHHNLAFTWGSLGLFEGQHVVLLERFVAELVLDVVERFRVEFMAVVPTMMRRIADVPGVGQRDLSSLRGVLHSGAPCSDGLKRFWIDLVGAQRLYEGFGATEAVGLTLIRGDEWLLRPGSVGRGVGTDIRIFGADGREVPVGAVGEIWMRAGSGGESYRYLGAEPAPTSPDGFTSLGDLGSLDAEGYLYPADRRVDLIITGGSNVYPAEVEAALLDHPQVSDAVVIGLPDLDWGKRVHALVVPHADARGLTAHDLETWCRSRLSSYKTPKTFELLDALPRDEAGKLHRGALVEARTP